MTLRWLVRKIIRERHRQRVHTTSPVTLHTRARTERGQAATSTQANKRQLQLSSRLLACWFLATQHECSVTNAILPRNAALPLEKVGGAVLERLRARIEAVRVTLAKVLHATKTHQQRQSSSALVIYHTPLTAAKLMRERTFRSAASRWRAMPDILAACCAGFAGGKDHKRSMRLCACAVW